MRLVDLDPRWLLLDGRRVGFIFRSPTRRTCWQTCFVEALERRLQAQCVVDLFGEENGQDIQLCKVLAWKCTPPIENASFDSLSIQPSIDGSQGGNWHGFITAGQIVGGV